MAYQTGTNVANLSNLMTLLVTFANTDGWTVNQNNWPTWVSFTSGGCTVHFTQEVDTFNDEFGSGITDTRAVFFLSSSYNNSANIYSQPNSLVSSLNDDDTVVTNDLGGPFPNYWFFSGAVGEPKYIYVVIETASGHFSHIYFGNLDKLGASYSGGGFCYGSFYNWWPQDYTDSQSLNMNWETVAHKVLFDDRQNLNVYMGTASPTVMVRDSVLALFDNTNTAPLISRGATEGRWADTIFGAGANPLNGVTPFLPCPVLVSYSADSALTQCPGMLPGVRLCSLNGRSPREVVTIAPDNWVVFPMRRQTETPNTGTPVAGTRGGTSWNYGVAIKRNV